MGRGAETYEHAQDELHEPQIGLGRVHVARQAHDVHGDLGSLCGASAGPLKAGLPTGQGARGASRVPPADTHGKDEHVRLDPARSRKTHKSDGVHDQGGAKGEEGEHVEAKAGHVVVHVHHRARGVVERGHLGLGLDLVLSLVTSWR